MSNLVILLAAHNRKPQTLACLVALSGQTDIPVGLKFQFFLVDDGCTDGTVDAVVERFPEVKILAGTGNLYWNGGMRLAFGTALLENFDYYLWLNDDTLLFPNAVSRLLAASVQFEDQAIVVASVQDAQTGQLTYGGVRRLHRWKPLRFTQITPVDKPTPVETMNGNCVLIPCAVAQKIGNLDPTFTHGIGDYDYGLRARQQGVEIYLAAGYYGYCSRNSPQEKENSWLARWNYLISYKGLPPKEWGIFARRYAGSFWPIFWLSPYIHHMLWENKNCKIRKKG